VSYVEASVDQTCLESLYEREPRLARDPNGDGHTQATHFSEDADDCEDTGDTQDSVDAETTDPNSRSRSSVLHPDGPVLVSDRQSTVRKKESTTKVRTPTTTPSAGPGSSISGLKKAPSMPPTMAMPSAAPISTTGMHTGSLAQLPGGISGLNNFSGMTDSGQFASFDTGNAAANQQYALGHPGQRHQAQSGMQSNTFAGFSSNSSINHGQRRSQRHNSSQMQQHNQAATAPATQLQHIGYVVQGGTAYSGASSTFNQQVVEGQEDMDMDADDDLLFFPESGSKKKTG
jgi:hypothetical protein